LESFQQRLDLVADTLAEVQADQLAARVELETTRYLTAEVVKVVQSPFDSNSVVLKQQRKLEKSLKHTRKLASRVSDSRYVGPLADIAQEVHRWAETCHRELHALGLVLQTEITQFHTKLQDQQGIDGGLPSFDRQLAMKEVKQYLKELFPTELAPLDETDDSTPAQILREVQEILVLLREAKECQLLLSEFYND
jgi:hypothetical protein